MESVSNLMDGELNVDDAVREIARLKSDAAFRENWDTFHLIGDVMRGSAAGTRGFAARLGERLALEPTVLAPLAARPAPQFTRRFQNRALALAASLAAVAVVGWVAITTVVPNTPGQLATGVAPQSAPQIAAAPGPATQPPVAGSVAAPEAGVQAAAAAPAERMQEYLLAHQGISPSTAIQGVTPYIRTVSGSDE
jgi:sigma-E factor negative regulatory protein RseA